MDWQTFTISILGSGVVAALVTAFVNGLMNHRTQIQAIKESGLYKKRADVLDELMEKMELLDRITGELVSVFQTEITDDAEDKRRQKSADAFGNFLGYYINHRHYLPKKLANEIDTLCKEYKSLIVSFSLEARRQGEKPDLTKWNDIVKKHQGDLVEKREKVAEEFRKIIGVE